MKNEFEHYDLRTLLDIYMKESKEFSTALEAGASWQILQEKRTRISLINFLINKKYDEANGSERFRNRPPHGD
jgi:hypothetical protein